MISSMRNLLFFLLFSFSFFKLSAQSPVYLLFTQDCVDQLEYRAAYGSATTLVYSVHPNPDAQFLLTAGSSGITSKSKPEGSRSCREFVINDAFADVINKGARQVYMVHQTSSGYLLMPLIACTQVTRYASVYQVRGPRYSFAIDTNNLVNEQNIAAPNSGAYIYFNGLRFRECRREYSFRRVPTETDMERSDIDCIPGIGLTSDKTGKTASEAEGNRMVLTKVNGIALDDYLVVLCKNQPAKAAPSSTVSKWSGDANYGNTNPYAVDKDKESASLPANAIVGPPPPPTNAGALPVACTEAPGYGYHLVMPGESLNAIARSYRVDVKDLVKWNKLKNANHLEVCQKIWLMPAPAGASMISVRKDAVAAPKPIQHNAPATKYEGPTVVRQDHLWQAKQPEPSMVANPASSAVAPIVYNAGATNYVSPIVYNTTGTTNAPTVLKAPQPFVHTVTAGETVSGIARYYGISEECLRYQNNMPLTGNPTIYVHQNLTIALCQPGTLPIPATTPAQYNTGSPAPVTAPETTPPPSDYTYNPQTGKYEYNPRASTGNYIYNPKTGQYEYQAPTATPRPGAFLEGNPAAPLPNQYNTSPQAPVQPDARPDVFDETAPVNGGGNNPNFTGKGGNTAPTRYFTEHSVKQGETLRSIAIKYNISTAELAQLNSISENESLMPGKRLVVPK